MRCVPHRPGLVGCCFFAALLAVLGLVGCSGGFQGSPASSTSESAPKVTSPASVTVVVGQTATFSVTATGTGPFTYQWFENGTAIPGATSGTYTTSATGAGQSGTVFTVVVTNSAGTARETPSISCSLYSGFFNPDPFGPTPFALMFRAPASSRRLLSGA